MGMDVRGLLKSESLSPSLREYIEKTDVDGDGMISVDELLKVLETERMLRRERTLLIRISIALGVSCVLIIAAVVGLTYAVVHLSKDTSVQDNVLVTKGTSDAISTASMHATYPLKDWYKVTSVSELEGLTKITVPFGDGISTFTIQDIYLVPKESVRFDTGSENVSITVSESGISVSGDEKNSTASRRRLMSSGEPEGTVSGQVLWTSTGKRKKCWANVDCDSGECDGVFSPFTMGLCTLTDKLATGTACILDSDCEAGNLCGFSTVGSSTKECCKVSGSELEGIFFKTYCPRKTANGQKCDSDGMCESDNTHCKGSTLFSEGICTNLAKISEPCDDGVDCSSSACGRPSATDGATKVCCPSAPAVIYAGFNYCKGMAVGSTCWSDSMCQTGFCQNNFGGLKKGRCQSTSKPKYEGCQDNEECASKACGRISAIANSPLVCCDDVSSHVGYDYCTNMPAGSVCWLDSMCVSTASNCNGNLYGLQRGICTPNM